MKNIINKHEKDKLINIEKKKLINIELMFLLME